MTDFEADNKLSTSERHQHVGHMGIAGRSDEAAPELISRRCIETSSN